LRSPTHATIDHRIVVVGAQVENGYQSTRHCGLVNPGQSLVFRHYGGEISGQSGMMGLAVDFRLGNRLTPEIRLRKFRGMPSDETRQRSIQFHAACLEHYQRALRACERESERAKIEERIACHTEALNRLVGPQESGRVLH
jgi:hypothetical protein